jgi:curved DNA-binding protein CbpA
MRSAYGMTDPFATDPASDDPFALLGLPARPDVTDDDVRSAWRRIAAATHPDREDGGDPARFGAAAAAYAMLRTGYGRGEALADLGLAGAADRRAQHARRRGRRPGAAVGRGRHRARGGSPADAKHAARPLATPSAPWWQPAGGVGQPGAPGHDAEPSRAGRAGWFSRWRPTRSRSGRRPARPSGGLALPVAGAAGVGVLVLVISGWSPGLVGVLAGVLTWLLTMAGRAYARRRSQ